MAGIVGPRKDVRMGPATFPNGIGGSGIGGVAIEREAQLVSVAGGRCYALSGTVQEQNGVIAPAANSKRLVSASAKTMRSDLILVSALSVLGQPLTKPSHPSSGILEVRCGLPSTGSC